ncbi:hypothetical protein K470DRAFT_135659 [Piedraia hortae CBS 480.64]|uniref:Uncharacterized protein n=1 Tax=Piedraia hortae CBS 480.64 TaxID=1314780 RepID=A0A6A7BU80_9PEZI|nr:hypothetical protein K470DRAFT_135659 [Piedraia hortae CBS 480.64]
MSVSLTSGKVQWSSSSAGPPTRIKSKRAYTRLWKRPGPPCGLPNSQSFKATVPERWSNEHNCWSIQGLGIFKKEGSPCGLGTTQVIILGCTIFKRPQGGRDK